MGEVPTVRANVDKDTVGCRAGLLQKFHFADVVIVEDGLTFGLIVKVDEKWRALDVHLKRCVCVSFNVTKNFSAESAAAQKRMARKAKQKSDCAFGMFHTP